MKITTRDKKLLLFVGGLLLFVVIYMYAFLPLQEKCEQMDSQIVSLERENEELEAQYANADVYEEEIEVYRKTLKEDMKSFPTDVKEEDIVMFILDLQEKNGVEISHISFSGEEELMNFQSIAEVDGTEKQVNMTGKKVGVSTSTELTYVQLKDFVKYINEEDTQTTLENITIVYNSGEDILSTSFSLARYALSYDGAEYVGETLPEVEIGQEDVFGEN